MALRDHPGKRNALQHVGNPKAILPGEPSGEAELPCAVVIGPLVPSQGAVLGAELERLGAPDQCNRSAFAPGVANADLAAAGRANKGAKSGSLDVGE